jgi:KipI family sensor histidine kinase inhibitor
MNTMPLEVEPLGDRAVVLRFGDAIDREVSARVIAAWRTIDAAGVPGIVDLVPAYTTVTVHYDWQALPDEAAGTPWQWLAQRLSDLLAGRDRAPTCAGRTVEIPVCYEAPFAPDLDDVAATTGLSPAEVIRRHGAIRYQVAFLGFRPGFPYLLGLDPALAVPRLTTPRASIPAGSVGLGGAQTGVYTTDGPGGWRLIGRTPLTLFVGDRTDPATLQPGDDVRFVRIDADEFVRLSGRGSEPTVDHAQADVTGPIDGAPPAQSGGVIEVLAPGIHTSLQDLGRAGWRHLGIGAAGASDTLAATLANALVGNAADAPVLEMTLRGPDLHIGEAVTIALAGDGMDAFADDVPVPFARPVRIGAGARLSFRSTGAGARAWLAIAGGFRAVRWLGSASADFGGRVFGRALQAGDRLAVAAPPPAIAIADHAVQPSRWWIDAKAQIDSPMILRFVVDAQADPGVAETLAAQVWRTALAADRTGVRLDGRALTSMAGGGRISAGVLLGTIQIPPDGLPILLGPDGQTTGGYPVAGHVVEADLPRLAQLKPGDLVWLQPIALADAHAARVAQAALVARLRVAISGKLRHA